MKDPTKEPAKVPTAHGPVSRPTVTADGRKIGDAAPPVVRKLKYIRSVDGKRMVLNPEYNAFTDRPWGSREPTPWNRRSQNKKA